MSLKQSGSDIGALTSNGLSQADTAKLILKTAGVNMAKTVLFKQGIGTKAIQEDYGFIPQGAASSQLGNFVFSNLEFPGPIKYTDPITGRIIRVEATTIETVLFNVSQTKNIITTPIAGRNGTVKEYISDGDFNINIKGVLTAPNGVYPKNEVDNLINILRAPQSIKISSWFLSMFGIYDAVVSDFNIVQIEGSQSYQPFQINLMSDEPIELT